MLPTPSRRADGSASIGGPSACRPAIGADLVGLTVGPRQTMRSIRQKPAGINDEIDERYRAASDSSTSMPVSDGETESAVRSRP